MPRLLVLRRYPVKAMAGETLELVQVDARGIEGDRWFAATNADGRFASGKSTRRMVRHDEIFEYAAQTTLTGGVVVRRGGLAWPVGDPGLDADLSARLGEPVRVLPEGTTPHFDDGPVSLVGRGTLAWLAERTGRPADLRRLRVNLVVDVDEPFAEEAWVGAELAAGSARLRVTGRIERCRTIDLAQDGADAARPWLGLLGSEREASAGVYAEVTRPGLLRTGGKIEPLA